MESEFSGLQPAGKVHITQLPTQQVSSDLKSQKFVARFTCSFKQIRIYQETTKGTSVPLQPLSHSTAVVLTTHLFPAYHCILPLRAVGGEEKVRCEAEL